MDNLVRDARHALRQIRKTPVFSVTTILTLAVATGAVLFAFGIAKTILWKPLPVTEPEKVVAVYNRAKNGTGEYSGLAYTEFDYLQRQRAPVSNFAAYVRVPFYFRTGDQTERIIGEFVTSEFFSVLPIRTVIGSTLHRDRSFEVVLSSELWQRVFHGDPGILGRVVELNEKRFTVVGVADPEFRGVLMDWQEPPQFWVDMATLPETQPIYRSLLTEWRAHSLMTVARVPEGVTPDQLTSALRVIDARMSQDHPERLQAWNGDYSFALSVLPIQQARFFPGYRHAIVQSIGLVTAVATMVLLLACLNIAGLMLIRGLAGTRDVAIRTALGASRWRLLRLFFVETTFLTSAGCIGGWLVASWTWQIVGLLGRPFRVALPPTLEFDGRMFALMAGIAFLTSSLFALWPAWRAAHTDLSASLKQDALNAGTPGRAGNRPILIGLQVALAVVLLVGAGLFIQTVQNASKVDRLTDWTRVGIVQLDLASANYDASRASRFFEELLARVRAIPGVEHAAYASKALLSVTRSTANVTLTRQGQSQPIVLPADYNLVSNDFFSTVGIPLLNGRDFSENDTATSPGVAIVNETMAKTFWPGVSALGQQFRTRQDALVEVVGIVHDTRTRGIRSAIEPAFYRPVRQLNFGELKLHIRSAGVEALFPVVRQTAREIDSGIPIVSMMTMQEQAESMLSQERLVADLCIVLGAVALSLTIIGLYGATAFSVQTRRREIGIRMAIGATRRDVLRLIVRQCLGTLLAGLVLGLVAAAAMTRLVASILYGVNATDGLSFAAAAVVVTAATLVAVIVPARRAASAKPFDALHAKG